VIRLSHVALPPGLNALARRSPDDDLIVYVSDALEPERQRAAVRVAVRASRPSRWHALLPMPSAVVLLVPGVSWLRRAAGLVRAHAVAWGTASAVLAAATAAVYFAAPPHPHSPAGGARPGVPGVSAPHAPARPAASPRASRHPGSHPVSTPAATPRGAAGSPAAVTARPTPAPVTSPSPSAVPTPSARPTPAPSTSPSPKGRHCIMLLGVRVCLGVAA
jgi:hypothetical protein